jgi:hypothetical protein
MSLWILNYWFHIGLLAFIELLHLRFDFFRQRLLWKLRLLHTLSTQWLHGKRVQFSLKISCLFYIVLKVKIDCYLHPPNRTLYIWLKICISSRLSSSYNLISRSITWSAKPIGNPGAPIDFLLIDYLYLLISWRTTLSSSNILFYIHQYVDN